MVPLGERLVEDPRCSFLHADFFQWASSEESAEVRFDAILIDIDHSPESLLQPSHASFYSGEGAKRLARRLNPGGVVGYWSADPPPEEFCQHLKAAFSSVEVETIDFYNPFVGEEDTNTIIIAMR